MKIKQHLIIYNVDSFLLGSPDYALLLLPSPSVNERHFNLGEVEIHIDVDMNALKAFAEESNDQDAYKRIMEAIGDPKELSDQVLSDLRDEIVGEMENRP